MHILLARAVRQTLLAAALSLVSLNVAAAERATVSLTQGATVSGELLDYQPGDHVTLDVGTGTPLTIPAEKVRTVSVGDSGAAPSTAAKEPRGHAPAPDMGFNFGVRLAYALPWGRFDSDDGLSVSESVSGQVPLIFDAGYRIDHFVVGLQFQYGFAFRTTAKCEGTTDCSTKDLRLGLALEYRLSPREQIDPWVGVGVGYEWLSYSDDNDGRNRSGGIRGMELLALSAGVDFRVAKQLNAGPFVSFSVGQYSANWRDTESTEDIGKTAAHGWITFGVRGNYGTISR